MSDIDTEVVDNLKVLDPRRPIREATGLMRHSKTTRSANSIIDAVQQPAFYSISSSWHIVNSFS